MHATHDMVERKACDERFRYNPRITVGTRVESSMPGALVAESAHEGPFSFSDDNRHWDISDAYERRYFFETNVFDVRFAVVSDTEIMAVYTSFSREIHEQVRGVARIVTRPGSPDAILESCVCETTEQITLNNFFGKCTTIDSVFRGFKRSDYKPLNEYLPLRFTSTISRDWKTLFLPTGYSSIVLGSVLEKESEILASDAEYRLRVEAVDQRFPIYIFNRDRALLVRQHAMESLVRDIEHDIQRDRKDAKSALSDVLPFGDDILDAIVSFAIVDTSDRVRSISRSDFIDNFRVGDTPFMLLGDNFTYKNIPDYYGRNSWFCKSSVISWYMSFFSGPRKSRASVSESSRLLRYGNADPKVGPVFSYYTLYPGYFSYIDRPISTRDL